jgi:hypothetical protein
VQRFYLWADVMHLAPPICENFQMREQARIGERGVFEMSASLIQARHA